MNQGPLYGLVAEFGDAASLVKAARQAHEEGYRRMDAHAPFPIEGLPQALGFSKTHLPLVALIGGILGCAGGYFMQYYSAVLSYPVGIGGRPLHSWPAFIPVTFELTVLVSALFIVLGMLGLNGLPMPYHPLFNVERFARASRDCFFLCIEATDPRFDRLATQRFLVDLGARAVFEVEP